MYCTSIKDDNRLQSVCFSGFYWSPALEKKTFDESSLGDWEQESLLYIFRSYPRSIAVTSGVGLVTVSVQFPKTLMKGNRIGEEKKNNNNNSCVGL